MEDETRLKMLAEIEEKVKAHKWIETRSKLLDIHNSEVADFISYLPEKEAAITFRLLPTVKATSAFSYFDRQTQENIIRNLGKKEVSEILNQMSPDDRTAFLAELPDQVLKETMNLLTDDERRIASSLLGYGPNDVGRLMTPYYIQVGKEWTVEQTFKHIRRRGRKAETLHIIYVVNERNQLIDDIRIGDLLMAQPDTQIEKLMDSKFIALQATADKEDAVQIFKQYDRSVLPVVTENQVLVGIVTSDDILDVAEAEATEDIQKFGGLEALELPYVQTPFLTMVKKRAGWLIVLFLGEMLTASAMGYFDEEIEKAVVLALFVPLIISSGGNSGSQAATLIIRAMALKELTLKDWWYVMRRELFSGLSLGVILGTIGFIRITIWQELGLFDYTEHWILVAVTIFFSLIGIVMWGTLSGSMIPFVLRRFGLDPATSSAPFVATLVDVTGLIIYFTIASIMLKGTLL